MAGARIAKPLGALPPTLTPNTLYLVRAGAGVDAYVSDTLGLFAVPFNLGSGGAVVFLNSGDPLPSPPQNGTVYISLSSRTIYYVGNDGQALVVPISEGSFLAKLYYAEAKDPVSAVGTGNNTMLELTETFQSGIYLIDVMYGWTADTTGNDFVMEVLVDGVVAAQPHQQEPQDSAGSVAWTNTNQLHTGGKRFTADFTDGLQHTITVRFRCSGANAVSMFDTTVLAWNLTELAQ